jgi:signal transduction histidine kinase
MDAMDGAASGRDIQIEIRSTGTEMQVATRDRGVGFPNAERAFEAFFTTKPNGMGMGLTICKSIVEAHGGSLEITRNADVGMTVTFTIPTVLNCVE